MCLRELRFGFGLMLLMIAPMLLSAIICWFVGDYAEDRTFRYVLLLIVFCSVYKSYDIYSKRHPKTGGGSACCTDSMFMQSIWKHAGAFRYAAFLWYVSMLAISVLIWATTMWIMVDMYAEDLLALETVISLMAVLMPDASIVLTAAESLAKIHDGV